MRLTRSLLLVPAPTLVRGMTSPINQSVAEITEGLLEQSDDGEWGLPSPPPAPDILIKLCCQHLCCCQTTIIHSGCFANERCSSSLWKSTFTGGVVPRTTREIRELKNYGFRWASSLVCPTGADSLIVCRYNTVSTKEGQVLQHHTWCFHRGA